MKPVGRRWVHARPDLSRYSSISLCEAPSIINDGAFYLALGDVRLNPIDLVDVAKVAFLLLRDGGHEGARIAITGPETLTMAEIADRISRAIGKTVRYVAVSPAARRQALIAHGRRPEPLPSQADEERAIKKCPQVAISPSTISTAGTFSNPVALLYSSPGSVRALARARIRSL